jgi:hypothetical protein
LQGMWLLFQAAVKVLPRTFAALFSFLEPLAKSCWFSFSFDNDFAVPYKPSFSSSSKLSSRSGCHVYHPSFRAWIVVLRQSLYPAGRGPCSGGTYLPVLAAFLLSTNHPNCVLVREASGAAWPMPKTVTHFLVATLEAGPSGFYSEERVH